MTDPQIHDIANNEDLRKRIEVRIAYFADYNINSATALKPKAQTALLNPAGEVEKFIWYATLNGDIQGHYSGATPLAEGDKDTPGTLTYAVNYVVEAKASILWA